MSAALPDKPRTPPFCGVCSSISSLSLPLKPCGVMNSHGNDRRLGFLRSVFFAGVQKMMD